MTEQYPYPLHPLGEKRIQVGGFNLGLKDYGWKMDFGLESLAGLQIYNFALISDNPNFLYSLTYQGSVMVTRFSGDLNTFDMSAMPFDLPRQVYPILHRRIENGEILGDWGVDFLRLAHEGDPLVDLPQRNLGRFLAANHMMVASKDPDDNKDRAIISALPGKKVFIKGWESESGEKTYFGSGYWSRLVVVDHSSLIDDNFRHLIELTDKVELETFKDADLFEIVEQIQSVGKEVFSEAGS
jgi:hypothetical protein